LEKVMHAHSRSLRRVSLLLLALAAGCGARAEPTAGAGKPGGGGPAGGPAGGNRAVPVAVATAVRRDVPVILEGLGAVVAYKTVTVHPRVEGQLESVGFKEGQEIKEGALLGQIDARPFRIQLHLAEAALARDTAQLRGSRLNLERYAEVRKDKLIAQQQVDDQRTSVEQLEASVKADEAQVENARLQLTYARITAPIDGVTGVRQVDPGNVVRPSDANGIVVITQLDPISVLFTLPQDELARVAEQMANGKLSVVALARDGASELGQGQVELIDNQINSATGTIRLKAVFANPKRTLWPNAFVKARLLLTTRQGALVIPAAAVQRGPKGTFVYVVGADQKAEQRTVEVSELQGDLALVSKGVEAGDSVVVDGQSQLRPGAAVSVKTPDGAGRDRGQAGQAGQSGAERSGGGGGADHQGGPRGGGERAGRKGGPSPSGGGARAEREPQP
jgi:multidrug efflux system membrane fusion protein